MRAREKHGSLALWLAFAKSKQKTSDFGPADSIQGWGVIPVTVSGAELLYYSNIANVRQDIKMKAEIHPEYGQLTATCSCGNVVEVGSTLVESIHIDVCSKCHPFYTGKQKAAETGGRIDRFNKRFGALGGSKK